MAGAVFYSFIREKQATSHSYPPQCKSWPRGRSSTPDWPPMFYLNKCLMQSFLENLGFSLQHEKHMTSGASDVKLASQCASASISHGGAHKSTGRLGARARSYTHRKRSSALAIDGPQRQKPRQTPSTEHWFAAAGTRSFKIMLD